MSPKKSKAARTVGSTKSRNSRNHSAKSKKGSLVIIGTGIRTVGQLTMESIAWIKEAEKLLYVVADPVAESVIKNLNPKAAESMAGYYQNGKPRIHAYNAMIDRTLQSVRSGNMTVAAFYGHPGVFAYPSHESIRIAKAEGFSARMLPAVSSEDCLFADLGVDPGDGGCQSYEATEFLIHSNSIEPCSQLVLWQIGILGNWTSQPGKYETKAMPLLIQKLSQYYPMNHVVTIYEAAIFTGTEPLIVKIPLYSLTDYSMSAATTLYIPPTKPRAADRKMMKLLAEVYR